MQTYARSTHFVLIASILRCSLFHFVSDKNNLSQYVNELEFECTEPMYYNFYLDEIYAHSKIEKYTTTLAFKFIFIRTIIDNVIGK